MRFRYTIILIVMVVIVLNGCTNSNETVNSNEVSINFEINHDDRNNEMDQVDSNKEIDVYKVVNNLNFGRLSSSEDKVFVSSFDLGRIVMYTLANEYTENRFYDSDGIYLNVIDDSLFFVHHEGYAETGVIVKKMINTSGVSDFYSEQNIDPNFIFAIYDYVRDMFYYDKYLYFIAGIDGDSKLVKLSTEDNQDEKILFDDKIVYGYQIVSNGMYINHLEDNLYKIDFYNENNEFVKNIFHTEANRKFFVMNRKLIICSGGLTIMDLETGKLNDIDSSKSINQVFVSNNNIYYNRYNSNDIKEDVTIRYNVNSDTKEKLTYLYQGVQFSGSKYYGRRVDINSLEQTDNTIGWEHFILKEDFLE